MKAYERLLNYVVVRTPSDENSETVPSSACQFDLARLLEAEMKELGIDPGEEKLSQIVEARLREEIKRGVQTIQYQVVTLMTTNGQAPFITVFMYLNEAGENQRLKSDLAIIVEEIDRKSVV